MSRAQDDLPLQKEAAARQRRGYWLRTLHQWHWISAAVCMIGMLLFSVTGITLNHASKIEAVPKVSHLEARVPSTVLAQLQGAHTDEAPLPPALTEWLASKHGIDARSKKAEWSEDELYVSMPGPGRDAWFSVQKADGSFEYERTDRGTLAYLNDLHKGRNAGAAWTWFIDIFAVACIVFTLSGLFLLYLHSKQRKMTWPMVGLGLLIPALLALLFIH
ncbi:PepSY-associated TM helix domain-containing protein [Lysobacter soyae]|uniref:PepSY-associated TM helix domain-containing protein n=1 Tax=Lysobacter soyae TaxID=2764185 RepID=A0ABX8WMI2_9GAMM|nr:PepSY-associated TM helix domain-containing protein [Lysobacter sp. CJ11]QYR52589.1 PepSY-associated TM helix domain-containing protein [Lysobacter sp. CJ11]